MRLLLCFLLLLFVAHPSEGHELKPAYLQLRQVEEERYEVIWKVPALGPKERMKLFVRFPDDCRVQKRTAGRFSAGAIVERFTIERPGGMAGGEIFIDGLSRTMTDVLVRVEQSSGARYSAIVKPNKPTFVVPERGSSSGFATTYIYLGFEHILLGVDHLLFVLGLLIIVSRRWMLIKTITSFTIAHSLTLAVATLGYASAPLPPLNVAISLSILFLGPEIVRAWRGQTSFTLEHPWLVAFAFGLLHGFGFASGLNTLGMAPADIPLSLLWFNVGVELGQLSFVLICLLMVRSFRVLEMRWPPLVSRLPGYTVGVCGAFWTIQRTLMMFSGR